MQTATRRSFDYDMPLIQTPTSACQIRQAWAKVADTPDRETAGRLKDEIKALLKEKKRGLGGALLRRSADSGFGFGNGRMRGRFAGDGALRRGTRS